MAILLTILGVIYGVQLCVMLLLLLLSPDVIKTKVDFWMSFIPIYMLAILWVIMVMIDNYKELK